MSKDINKGPSGLEGEKQKRSEISGRTSDEILNNFKPDSEAIKKEWESIKTEAVDFYDNNFKDEVDKPGKDAFVFAYFGYKKLNPKNKKYLTIVDFCPSNLNNGETGGRFYIINMETNTVEFSNKVGHGVNSSDSPEGSPDSYSNILGSKQSSLGFFKTAEHVVPGAKHIRQGLKLKGVEKKINSNASAREIYIHPAGLDQSEGCFTLPYDKAEKKCEQKIENQLTKIRGESIVFAYDSRVFGEYAKQSRFFSDIEDPGDGAGSYTIDGVDKSTIDARIKNNKEEPETFGFYDRGAEKLNNTFPRIFNLPNAIKKNRECWWKKKEVEMFTAQLLKEIKEKEKEGPNDLSTNINNARKGFRETFYKSKPKERRKNIDIWVSEFWKGINLLVIEKGDSDLKNSLASKKSEYEKWEKESAKNHRKIPESERAEVRLQQMKRKLSA